MEFKICKKCGLQKEIENFRIQRNKNYVRYCSWCKDCEKEYNANYNKTSKKRKDYCKKYGKNYRKKHHKELKEKQHKYYLENIDKIKEKYYKNNAIEPYWKKEWYKAYRKSPEFKIKKNLLLRNKMQIDKIYAYKMNTRKLISRAFYDKTFKKYDELEKIVGCSYDIFLKHLYNSFYINYGYEYKKSMNIKVNIDHIIPLNEAKTIEEINKLNNYTNLQLLTEKDNQLKGIKRDYKLLGKEE